MKGKIIQANYVWEEDPQTPYFGYFAVNCEELPERFDDLIVFYFENDEELEEAKSDKFDNDFKIIRVFK